MITRGSGLLLHITSLPSDFGIGDLGPQAYAFADFMSQGKQRFWQILPLNPVSSLTDYSPYSSLSAFAGNPLLISPEILNSQGLVSLQDMRSCQLPSLGYIRFSQVVESKYYLLDRAYNNFFQSETFWQFDQFCRQHAYWLDDYALFQALKGCFGFQTAWNQWPEPIKNREPQALEGYISKLSSSISYHKFLQFIFYQQWMDLKTYCNQKGIQIIGDLPIYVSYDSVDVWAKRQFFKLDQQGEAYLVAGVPPDYFSQTGQLWGNPVYNWQALEADDFSWWIQRMSHNFTLYDFLRIDHFRGLVAFWEVAAEEETAINGRWTSAPVYNFFRAMGQRFPCLPIFAEDLGEITAEVREVLSVFQIPNMKVLIFAFDNDDPRHPFLPHNYSHNCIVYTGTHDTNTSRGWFENEASFEAKQQLFRYLGKEIGADQLPWELIRLGMMSVANYVITPVQDILGLSQLARMNIPSTSSGNWRWRVKSEDLSLSLFRQLADLTQCYGRSN